MKEQQHSNQQQQPSVALSNSRSRTLQKYKRRLLLQVIAIFSICLLVILQRIFYQVIIQSEQKTLSSLQLNTDLIIQTQDGKFVAKEITNGFLNFMASLSQFRYQFLILTHLFVTLYVAADAYTTTKLVYITMGVIYLISLLQLLYGGERPFWAEEGILASGCLNGYCHPSLGLMLGLFVPYYGYYCWKKKSGQIFMGQLSNKQLAISISFFVVVALLQFLNYFTGMIFLVNLALSLICFTLLIMIVISTNGVLDQVIKKSTIIKVDAKKYVFYWLLFICLLQAFVLIVYSGQEVFLDIDWVRNYIKCTDYHQYDSVNYRYDQVIGPWYSFLQTATLFAWIGAVFGASYCFNKLQTPEWCKGTPKTRLLRALIGNLLIVPSWLFVVFLEKGTWIKDIGLNEYIVDAVHYFMLYMWLFGLMPVWVLGKLKLTSREGEDYYVVLQDRK